MNVLLLMNDLINFIKFIGVFIFSSLCRRPSCHTLSKAFSMSRKMAVVFSLLFVFLTSWLTSWTN